MIIESADLLVQAIGCSTERASGWLTPINEATQRFAIYTTVRMAAFLPQIAHESAKLSRVEENLNYSVEGLLKKFSRARISEEDAARYGRVDGKRAADPRGIANCIYGGEWGLKNLGNTEPDDGYRFRGMGLIQITGRRLRVDCGLELGLNLVEQPEMLMQSIYAALSAGWFWDRHGCNELADKGDMKTITKRINGGLNGLEDRLALWERAKKALNVA